MTTDQLAEKMREALKLADEIRLVVEAVQRECSRTGNTFVLDRHKLAKMIFAALTASGTKSDGAEPANWRQAEIVRLIDLLREREGNSVTILCDNPDFNGQPNCAVICNGDWTDWQDKRFAQDTILDALSAAMIEYMRPQSDGGVESRHAKTGNMSGAVPEEEQSLPASGFVRAFGPEDKTSKPRDGVAPIPSDPIPSQPDEREAIVMIDVRISDLHDANEIFARDPRDMKRDIQRNHREIMWLRDLRSIIILAMQAERRSVKCGRVSFQKLGHEFGISKRSAMRCAKRESYTDVQ